MRKALVFAFSLLCGIAGFAQDGKMTFDGLESDYEILSERRLGPGIKYTEYYFKDITSNHYSMRTLVVEIDNTNEYVYQSAYMVGYDNPDEKYNHVYHQAQSKEYEYKLQEGIGKRPIATVMAGGFVQKTIDSDGNDLQVLREVGGGLVANGIMHYMPQSGAIHYYIDNDGNVKIGVLKCNPTVEAANAGKHGISNYNRKRSNSPEGITLFACGYGMNGKFKTADIKDAMELGTEVLVTLDNGSSNVCSGTYTGKVAKILSGSGNTYGEDQVVLAAVGGEGEAWLKTLTEGETVTIDLQYYDAQNVPVQLQSCVKAFAGYAVKDGVAQSSKEKGYPEDALCLSKDGKKSFYIHLDCWDENPNLISNAPVNAFNQFIQQVPGVWEGILMDGGPSAEMYIRNSSNVGNSGEWVSQNYNRPIPAAIMVYSTAKKYTLPIEADFADYSKKLTVGEEYTPEYYFFNKYGDIVTSPTAANQVVLSCEPADFGTFSADGKTFIPQKSGKGYLCLSYKNSQDKIAVNVAGNVVLKADPEKIVDAKPGEKYAVSLYEIGADGSETLVNSFASWSTNASSVVSSCDNGIIVLAKPGVAEVYADYNGARAVIYVTVISGIGQIEATAPVSVSVAGDIVSVTANDSSVCSMSCQMYTVDGKLVVSESINGGSLKMTRRDASSPVVIVLTIDGKKYIYKLI